MTLLFFDKKGILGKLDFLLSPGTSRTDSVDNVCDARGGLGGGNFGNPVAEIDLSKAGTGSLATSTLGESILL